MCPTLSGFSRMIKDVIMREFYQEKGRGPAFREGFKRTAILQRRAPRSIGTHSLPMLALRPFQIVVCNTSQFLQKSFIRPLVSLNSADKSDNFFDPINAGTIEATSIARIVMLAITCSQSVALSR